MCTCVPVGILYTFKTYYIHDTIHPQLPEQATIIK